MAESGPTAQVRVRARCPQCSVEGPLPLQPATGVRLQMNSRGIHPFHSIITSIPPGLRASRSNARWHLPTLGAQIQLILPVCPICARGFCAQMCSTVLIMLMEHTWGMHAHYAGSSGIMREPKPLSAAFPLLVILGGREGKQLFSDTGPMVQSELNLGAQDPSVFIHKPHYPFLT